MHETERVCAHASVRLCSEWRGGARLQREPMGTRSFLTGVGLSGLEAWKAAPAAPGHSIEHSGSGGAGQVALYRVRRGKSKAL